MRTKTVKIFKSGTHNLLDSKIIPEDAASDSKNWITKDGRIQLVNGKVVVGDNGLTGAIYGEIFGYKTNGATVHWRKTGTKIQYFDGTDWQDVITGLSISDYSFMNYSSLAGTFTFAVGADGMYKMHNANPGSYISLYNSAKNFKGYALIDKGRMILWNRPEDKTGLYGSKIDLQSTNYTTVTGEATTSLTGTLAFKGGGATRNCFAVVITITASGEVYRENGLGVLTGSLGGTGTINYITGAYTLSNPGVGTAAYQWEDSNTGGVTDFTKSATRLAGEGFQFPQDEGGDAIMTVLIGPDGYYSLKKTSAYLLTLTPEDTNAENNVYNKEIGISSYRGATVTNAGIVFMNLANPEKPELTILKRNSLGSNLIPSTLFTQFKFANYNYDDCTIDTYERYVLIACKTLNSTTNNVILLCDIANKTVDITSYHARTFARDNGNLYMGSSIVESVYNLYNGYDDEGFVIDNFWTGKDEDLGSGDYLNKVAKIRLRGKISAGQSYQVYANYDNSGSQLVGTVLGTADYVDYSSPQTIGSNMIGAAQIGGDDVSEIYPYYMEIKLRKVPKFNTVKLTYIALGFGYVDISSENYFDIENFEQKLPTRFRSKQNVNISGAPTNQNNP
jgi:hypothetical protein